MPRPIRRAQRIKGIKVRLEIPPIISRAIQQDGDIHVSARRGVLISVHDRRIGIQPEDRAHPCDGFFRTSNSRVREQGGTGLDLELVTPESDSRIA